MVLELTKIFWRSRVRLFFSTDIVISSDGGSIDKCKFLSHSKAQFWDKMKHPKIINDQIVNVIYSFWQVFASNYQKTQRAFDLYENWFYKAGGPNFQF